MASTTKAALPKIPKSSSHSASSTTTSEYVRLCMALKAKPNSRIVNNEAAVLEADKVNLQSNYLGGLGFQAVVTLLVKRPSLHTLNISDNGLTNESVVFFARAFAKHPGIRVIDLSNNPISLPAASALIDLVHKNSRVTDINLEGTLIDEPLLRKLQRALNLNTKTHKSMVGPDGLTPFQRLQKDFQAKVVDPRVASRQLARTEQESVCATRVKEIVKGEGIQGPVRSREGWAVINLCVSSTPTDFHSELQVLHKKIIPELNTQLANRHIAVNVCAMYNDVSPHFHSSLHGKEALAVVGDYTTNVIKSKPIFLQLLGEKVGLGRFSADSTVPFSSVLQEEYAEAERQGCLRIVMTRKHAAQLDVPATLVSRLSDDPHVVIPDPNAHVVRAALTTRTKSVVGGGDGNNNAADALLNPASSDLDIEVEKQKWKAHCEYRQRILKELDPALVVNGYDVVFEGPDGQGNLTFGQLDGAGEFTTALKVRLLAAIEAMYPEDDDDELAAKCEATTKAVPDASASSGKEESSSASSTPAVYKDATFPLKMQALLKSSTEKTNGRRNILGKLDLYAVTPPSRNTFLLHAPGGSGTTSTLAAFLARSKKKPNYVLASHFSRQLTLLDEPSDPRTVFSNLAAQLLPDGVLPSYIQSAVDVMVVKNFFVETLAKIAQEVEDGKIIVICVDGLDDMDPMQFPCEALRTTETGVEAWQPALPPSTASPSPIKKPTPRNDGYDFIPVCLPRNVRWVGSCQSFGETHKTLEKRGHDSCDSISIGELGVSDVEQLLQGELKKISCSAAGAVGIELSDEQMSAVLELDDCRNVDYLRFLIESIRYHHETPHYRSLASVIDSFPHTLAEASANLLTTIEHDFGLTFTKRVMSLLMASRWGLRETELRELLVSPVDAAAAVASSNNTSSSASGSSSSSGGGAHPHRPLLRMEVFNALLRVLRPVLFLPPSLSSSSSSTDDETTNKKKVAGGSGVVYNGVDCVVHLRCRAFRDEVQKRYLSSPPPPASTTTGGGGAPPPEDEQQQNHHGQALQHTAHVQLAHHYRRIVGTASSHHHPLRSLALKELPYHLIQARMWDTFESQIVSLDYVAAVYKFKMGYAAIREYIRAYNTLSSLPSSSISGGDAVVPNKDGILYKIKEYFYFVRDHNVNLTQFPHMVHQIAVTCSAETHLHNDAKEHFNLKGRGGGEGEGQMLHFLVMGKNRAKIHREGISMAQFAPSGLRFATCSDDRSVRILNVVGEPLFSMTTGSRLKLLTYSSTSRYLAVVAEDRTTFVYDATDGILISKFHDHRSNIRCVALSARGRFVATGADDRTLKIWETETGVLLTTVNHNDFSHHTSAYGGVLALCSHPFDEDTFFTACDKTVLGWKLKKSRDCCEEILNIKGHRSNPIGSIHLVDEGNIIVTSAKDLSATPSTYVRSEESVKIWSVATGRLVAVVSTGLNAMGSSGSTLAAISPSEKYLVTALYDGRVQLHRMDFKSYLTTTNSLQEEGEGEGVQQQQQPEIVHPYRTMQAFKDHPVPRASHLCFSYDSQFVCAAGNQRQVKAWKTATAGTSTASLKGEEPKEQTGEEEGNTKAKKGTPKATTTTTSSSAVAAEFLMDQAISSIHWSLNPQSEGGELVVGDVVGRAQLLKLKHS